MKACVLRSPAPVQNAPLSFEEIPAPSPSDDEVLVRVRACAICRTDLHVIEGELPVRRTPLVPGHQAVGEVVATGALAEGLSVGQRVGIPWLRRTCGRCRFCTSRRENLCEAPAFTGWTADGGYAELAVVPASFAYPIPDGFDDLHAAPLLCAGIIGYRCLQKTGLQAGARLGLYGFGAAGHIVLQVARARGIDVHVVTREPTRHQALAADLGATWIGGPEDTPPQALDASIIFAPAGELVPVALRALDKGATLVLGGIHMSPIPPLPYELLYQERVIRSVANNTREDGRALFAEAARIPVRARIEIFPLEAASQALVALKEGRISGVGVLQI